MFSRVPYSYPFFLLLLPPPRHTHTTVIRSCRDKNNNNKASHCIQYVITATADWWTRTRACCFSFQDFGGYPTPLSLCVPLPSVCCWSQSIALSFCLSLTRRKPWKTTTTTAVCAAILLLRIPPGGHYIISSFTHTKFIKTLISRKKRKYKGKSLLEKKRIYKNDERIEKEKKKKVALYVWNPPPSFAPCVGISIIIKWSTFLAVAPRSSPGVVDGIAECLFHLKPVLSLFSFSYFSPADFICALENQQKKTTATTAIVVCCAHRHTFCLTDCCCCCFSSQVEGHAEASSFLFLICSVTRGSLKIHSFYLLPSSSSSLFSLSAQNLNWRYDDVYEKSEKEAVPHCQSSLTCPLSSSSWG